MTCLALLALAAPGGDPGLAAPFAVMAAGKPIKVDTGHAAPTFTDFDVDGLKDLLVGQFGEGKIRFYKNIGTATEPKFGPMQYVDASGKPIKVDAG